MDLKVSTYNNNFGAKMILEGFGNRSKDAKRWANIAELFERESVMYPNDELRICTNKDKKDYYFDYIIDNCLYHGWLKKREYTDFMKLSDNKIAKDFVRFNEIRRNVKMLLENSKEKIQSISNLFNDAGIKDEVRCRIYSIVREFTEEQGRLQRIQEDVLDKLPLHRS